jgi:hypothetical protein
LVVVVICEAPQVAYGGCYLSVTVDRMNRREDREGVENKRMNAGD